MPGAPARSDRRGRPAHREASQEVKISSIYDSPGTRPTQVGVRPCRASTGTRPPGPRLVDAEGRGPNPEPGACNGRPTPGTQYGRMEGRDRGDFQLMLRNTRTGGLHSAPPSCILHIPCAGFSKQETGIPPGARYRVPGIGYRLSGTWDLVPGTGAESTPRAEHRAPRTEPDHRKTCTPGLHIRIDRSGEEVR
jgi:hypothetical protein